MQVRVQAEDFDLGAELSSLNRDGAGAIVNFVGVVRDKTGDLDALELEHFPGLAEAQLGRILAEAEARWTLSDARIIHRYGRLGVGEQIMMVATVSAHREAAFEAASFLMDYLKTDAPFWKKEHRKGGSEWVAATAADDAAKARWDG